MSRWSETLFNLKSVEDPSASLKFFSITREEVSIAVLLLSEVSKELKYVIKSD